MSCLCFLFCTVLWCPLIQVHQKKQFEYHENIPYFCHSFQKVKPIYYIDSLHIEWNISRLYFLIFWGLWLTDNENQKFSVSENLNITQDQQKERYFKQECPASEKYVYLLYMYSILGWASFCMNYWINAAWHEVDDQSVALLRCNEAQVALIAAFRSSALLGLVGCHISCC